MSMITCELYPVHAAPMGSISSMEVNVDTLEQMDLMDVSDHEALDVFLNSGSEADEGALASPLPGAPFASRAQLICCHYTIQKPFLYIDFPCRHFLSTPLTLALSRSVYICWWIFLTFQNRTLCDENVFILFLFLVNDTVLCWNSVLIHIF